MQKQQGQEITKISRGIFHSVWHSIPNSELVLNFNPLIKEHNLNGQYVLLHWQARPKNLRTWGVYDSTTDMYYSIGSDDITPFIAEVDIIDVSEKIVKSVPTAVILFRGVSWINGRIT